MAEPLKRAVRTKVMLKVGLMSTIVGIHTAVGEDDEGDLNIICTNDHAPSRVSRQYICKVCSATANFGKGKVVDAGIVPVPADVIAASKEAIGDVDTTIDLKVYRRTDLNCTMPSGKSYYLKADGPHRGVYALIAALLESRPDLSVVGEFAMRDANATLYELVSAQGTLVMRQLARPDFVRERPVIDSPVDETELMLVKRWADSMVSEFDPAAYVSKRTKVISEYVASQVPVAPALPAAVAVEEPTTSHTNLRAALEAAIADAEKAEKAETKKPPARTPRKRTPRKPVAGKTPAEPAAV